MTSAQAREALDGAERHHRDLVADVERARTALDAAEQDNDASDDAARAVLRAREAHEVSKIRVTGAEKRIGLARAALRAAEVHEARDIIAANLPRADRAGLFDALAPTIAALVALDSVPAVDPFAALPDDEIAARLGEQAERETARKLAHRTIRRAVEVQHAAVASVLAAAQVIGERAPAVAPAPEAHVHALVALEVHALSKPTTIDPNRGWWPEWLVPAFAAWPEQASYILRRPREALGLDVHAWIQWARETCRIGDPDLALHTVCKARDDAARKAMEDAAPRFPFSADGSEPS